MTAFNSLWGRCCSDVQATSAEGINELIALVSAKLDVDQVAYEIIGRATLFLINLGPLGFKGLDLNVVMLVSPPRNDDERNAQVELLDQYRIAVRSIGICLLIYLANDDETVPPPDTHDTVHLTSRELERLLASDVPSSVLFGCIKRQIPLQRLCPFNTTHEARADMFYGRQFQVDKLTTDLETNFIISGARRIGKTSLLHKSYSILRYHPEYRDRTYLFNCINWGTHRDCFYRLAHEIEPKSELRITEGPRNIDYLFARKSRRGTRPLLIFCDEVDRIIETDIKSNWSFFNVLAKAVEQNHIRLVLAGYRSTKLLLHEHLGHHTPFHGSLRPVTLDPLSQAETHDLITKPFRQLDIHLYDPDAMQSHIWNQTAGHPFLIQFYGERLFDIASQRQPQHLVMEDLQSIDGCFELAQFVENHFLENTADIGRPARAERLCAFVMARSNTSKMQAGLIIQTCRVYSEGVTESEIREALANLVSAQIVTYSHGHYRFTLPILAFVIRQAYAEPDGFINTIGGQ